MSCVVAPLFDILTRYTLQYYTAFLRWNETRTDIATFSVLHDPILLKLTPMDLSIPLFVFAYGSVTLAFFHARDKPDLIVEMLQTKTFVIWVRMVRGCTSLFDHMVHY
jgi:hypothetical protein